MKWVTVACACLTIASSSPVQNAPRGIDDGKKVFKRGISSFGSLFGHSSLFPGYGHLFSSAVGTIASPSLSSFSPFASHPHLHEENHKTTVTVTKKVPVPYAVTVERKVPFKIEVPVDRPYPVYVPKPYPVYIEKKVPYEVKVAVPQPYEVEKKVPVPVEVPYDRPYPVHIEKPYPVIFEKKVHIPVEKPVPVPVKIPVDRPFPIHIPVEKFVPYPIEKPIPYPVKIPVEKPVAIPVNDFTHHYSEKPLSWDGRHFAYPSRYPFQSDGFQWTDDVRTADFYDKSGLSSSDENDDNDQAPSAGLERRRQSVSEPATEATDESQRVKKASVLDARRRIYGRQHDALNEEGRGALNATSNNQADKENAINKT